MNTDRADATRPFAKAARLEDVSAGGAADMAPVLSHARGTCAMLCACAAPPHRRHPEGERDEVARVSRRMEARSVVAAILRDGRAQARAAPQDDDFVCCAADLKAPVTPSPAAPWARSRGAGASRRRRPWGRRA